MIEWNADAIETDDDLQVIGATIAYALRRETELVGMMLDHFGASRADVREASDPWTCLLLKSRLKSRAAVS